MISQSIDALVNQEISIGYANSMLASWVNTHGPYAIKFVQSRWADPYCSAKLLKVSETPALTWGTATYVTPLAFPLSSALYGRVGLVAEFDASAWRIFDATRPSARTAYVRWAQAQPAYSELMLTVHSTQANHQLRNRFREAFGIDCVLFHPDQEAELHTDAAAHVWMAVTDWADSGVIDPTFSRRLKDARFTVLLDEEFLLQDQGLPIRRANRQIETATEKLHRTSPQKPLDIRSARLNPALSMDIRAAHSSRGYVHLFIEP